MRCLAFRLIVALLTFTIGIATASLRFVFRHSSPVTIVHEENFPPSPAPGNQERTYDMGAVGKAVTKDGTPASISSWHTSDGMRFSRWSEYHDSPKRANRELQRTLKKAAEIIKREPLLNEAGHQVGEKAIARFPPKYPYYGAATLLLTDGSTFRYVSSSSLQNILEYEKDINR